MHILDHARDFEGEDAAILSPREWLRRRWSVFVNSPMFGTHVSVAIHVVLLAVATVVGVGHVAQPDAEPTRLGFAPAVEGEGEGEGEVARSLDLRPALWEQVPELRAERPDVESHVVFEDLGRRPLAEVPGAHVSFGAEILPPVPEEAPPAPRDAPAPQPSAPVPASPLAGLNRPPVYPRLARRMGLEGDVAVEVVVCRDGSVDGVSVVESSGHAVLDRAAVAAVREWQFRPAALGGRSVEATYRTVVRFVLGGPGRT